MKPTARVNPQLAIVPRQDLDFRLDDDIPRFWFGGDPFRTRLFDAHSLLVPAGERFFINCVRDYRDRIGDPQLREAVRAFILQEGQHSQQHALSNQRLAAQGVAVAEIEARQQRDAEALRQAAPRSFSLALAAAYEHLTTYAWFRPGFHPAKVGGLAGYQRWRETYIRTNDPFAAAAAMRATPAG